LVLIQVHLHRKKKNQDAATIAARAKNQQQLHQLQLFKFHMVKLTQLEEQSNMLPKLSRIELKLEKPREKLKLELPESMLNSIRRKNKKIKEKT